MFCVLLRSEDCGLMIVWAKWMEYRWPVDIVFSSKKTFEIAGLAQAALT